MAEQPINVDQLCEGLYVCLDLPWLKHPFFLSSFKITNARQLKALKGLGLQQIIYDPAKSDAEPLPARVIEQVADAGKIEQTAKAEEVIADAMWRQKRERIDRLQQRRVRMKRCENRYRQSVGLVKNVLKNLSTHPEDAMGAAKELVSDMVESLMVDKDIAVHLVNINSEGQSAYFHVINVAVLSMMLGKRLGVDSKRLRLLGQGALLHDIGKSRIPHKVLHKVGPRTQAEQRFYQMHPLYGVEIASKSKVLPLEIVDIIAQHHESIDGSGFPRGLKGDEIAELARIVSIANAYDNYCNGIDKARSMTPFEAVSYMFAKKRHAYDDGMLQPFINLLGVYPPGTVVKLSGEHIGMVLSVNPANLLRPSVLLYNPQIPKNEAMIVDLNEEEELEIIESIQPACLSEEVFDYLNLAMSVNYYYHSASGRPSPNR